jgi:hypothetical protein
MRQDVKEPSRTEQILTTCHLVLSEITVWHFECKVLKFFFYADAFWCTLHTHTVISGCIFHPPKHGLLYLFNLILVFMPEFVRRWYVPLRCHVLVTSQTKISPPSSGAPSKPMQEINTSWQHGHATCFAHSLTLKVEAICSSEISGYLWTTCCYSSS